MPYSRSNYRYRRGFRGGFRTNYRRVGLPQRRRLRYQSRGTYYRPAFKRQRMDGPERNRFFTRRFCFRTSHYTNNIVILNGSSSDTPLAYTITTANIPDWVTRSAGFEQYKIYMWKIEFLPPSFQHVDPDHGTTSSDNCYGLALCWHYLIADYNDDSTASISTSRMMNTPGVKFCRIFRPLSMIIRPKIEKIVAVNTGTTSFGHTEGRGWLSVDDLIPVKHYGFKYLCQQTPWTGGTAGTRAFVLQVRHTIWYGLKNLNAGAL